MKILLALDSSVHSERALEFITRVRWPAGSRVIVVSVLQPLIGAGAGPFEAAVIPEGLIEEQQRQARVDVAAAEARLRDAGFPTESRIETGDPRDTLVQVARDERADILVVGSHGRTGLAKLMLGSVSSHVVTHAPCSVLVVKTHGSRTVARAAERSST